MKRCSEILALMILALLAAAAVCRAAPPPVCYLNAVGTVNPGMAEFILAGIDKAEKQQAQALVVQLDTPGGLDTSMRQIVQGISNARVPVIVYVAPSGARAASAGVFITQAAQVAAMAPGTNIGAAHPVSIGMGGKMDKTMETKVLNDFVAYGRSLAEEHGRNPDWMEKAIRQSVSISASEALKLKVVDLMADNLDDLLAKVNGRRVQVAGKPQVLLTAGAPLREIPENLRYRILGHIADPNIAFVLMMIGLAGIYFELAHPGVVLPGVVGATCLLLALFAFQTLPVNYIGVLLILLSFVFFVLEFKVSSYGMLSVAGVAALLLGAIMLFREPGGGGMGVSWGILLPTVFTVSLFFIAVAGIVFRSHRKRVVSGAEGLVGEQGVAVTPLAPVGRVFIHGENWEAASDEPIAPREPVEVLAVRGLKLRVRRVTPKS
ncbi:MAG: nodulation protein NfeD [Desulfobaccales bacterium]